MNKLVAVIVCMGLAFLWMFLGEYDRSTTWAAAAMVITAMQLKS
jgi:hypothetical protein